MVCGWLGYARGITISHFEKSVYNIYFVLFLTLLEVAEPVYLCA